MNHNHSSIPWISKKAICVIFYLHFLCFHSITAQTYKLAGTGRLNGGSVYAINTDGKNPSRWVDFTVGTNPEYTQLIEYNGKLWGMTSRGGSHDKGTIFNINKDGSGFQKVHNFNDINGAEPKGSLTEIEGFIWGMTSEGGSDGRGVVFRIKDDGSEYAVIHNFKSNNTEGSSPYGSLIESNNKIWGMTSVGGTDRGVIFSIEKDASDFTVVHNFSSSDGLQPLGSLMSHENKLWGMTSGGGASDNGTIFSLNNNGTGFVKEHDFNGVNGDYPIGGLIYYSGKFLGMTSKGGANDLGTIFSINTDGSSYAIIKNFSDKSEGTVPYGNLLEKDGVFYGTASNGAFGSGKIFSINHDGSGYNILYDFGQAGNDGSNPRGTLVFSNDKLWGMTYFGGELNHGTIFNVNTNGTDYFQVHNFSYDKGFFPSGRLVESNERLWGTTQSIGNDNGFMFNTDIDGSGFRIIHEFDGIDGSDAGPLVAYNDQLWGMTKTGGIGKGTIHFLNNDGTGFTKVHEFDNTDGQYPYGALMESNDKLWGMTQGGGVYGKGVIFYMNTDGTGFIKAHDFNGNDGANPYGELFESNGKLWGLTHNGGQQNYGVIFSINLDGTGYTKHYDLYNEGVGSPNGSFAEANEKLWALMDYGGIININKDGSDFSKVHEFTDGNNLYGNLMYYNQRMWGVSYQANGGYIFNINTDGTAYEKVLDLDPTFGAQPYYSYGLALIAVDQNHRPTFTAIPTQEFKEDDPDQLIRLTDFFDDIEDGNIGLEYSIKSITNASIFSSTTILDGALIFDLEANRFGSTEITIRGGDTGGKFIDETFTVNIIPVADNPTISSSSTSYGVKTTSGLVVTRNAVDGNEVDYIQVSDITNATLYLNNGSTIVNNNSFVAYSKASKGFKLTPTGIGTASFSIQASVGNTVAGLGGSKIQATASVSKRILTATASDISKIYGTQNPDITISYNGFVLGEDASVLDSPPVASTSVNIESDVGSYDILISRGNDDFYDIEEFNGVLTITKASLFATAEDKSKVYGSINPELTILYEGFVNGEDASVIDQSPTVSTEVMEITGSGNYAINISSGSDNNYEIESSEGVLTIKKAWLEMSIENANKIYGEPNPDFTIQYAGFVLDDDEHTLDNFPIASTTANTNSDVGEYSITINSHLDSNYEIKVIDGSLTISKATLIAMSLDSSMPYGEENLIFSIEYSGFLNDDSEIDIDYPPMPTSSATSKSDVGRYEIVLTEGTDNNYIIELVDGILTIDKADQIITFNDLPIANLVQGYIEVEAISSSGLLVSFNSENEYLATIDGNTVKLLDLGIVNIVASQEGNLNYNPAAQVTQPLTIAEVTDLKDVSEESLKLYPNPGNAFFKLDIGELEIQHVRIYDQNGKVIRKFDFMDNMYYDISTISVGFYLVVLETEGTEVKREKLIIRR